MTFPSFTALFFLTVFIGQVLAAVPAWSPPLSTRGRWIVDSTGKRFKLKSGSWYGASGTYSGSGDINDDANHHGNENAHTLPLALQYVPINQILDSFEQLGVNSIRLQFSNEMLHDNTIVQDAWVGANPQLRGKTPLQVFDAVIDALTARGFAVILNNMTNKSKWCCAVDGNERWNESQSDDAWINDWVFLVQRYRNNPRVVGADLYNEVRRDVLDDPNWNGGDEHDWYRFAQFAADRIHADANPDILIIIEGINWVGIPVDGFYHHRPTLEVVGGVSHALMSARKLVYSAHFYDYTGPSHSGATGIGETSDPRYRDFSRDDLFKVMTSQAGYVAFDNNTHYTAPVWISEFGVAGRGGIADNVRAWFTNTLDYLKANDLDYSVWPLTGYLGPNWSDSWALMNWNPQNGQRDGLYDGNDWRADLWTSLSQSGRSDIIPMNTQYNQLNIDHDDYMKSLIQRGRGDWDSGARKAMCPDGLRVIGVSRSHRALCTDATYGNMWDASKGFPTTTVTDERYVVPINGGDWASGYTKYHCPPNNFVVGYAVRGSKVSSVLCAQANRNLGLGGSFTRWFDRNDNRPQGATGGDWSTGQLKGQCGDDEYMAGIAFTTRFGSSPNAAAILCLK